MPTRLSLRERAAIVLGRFTRATARRAHVGGGTVIGARVTLALAPKILDDLAAERMVAIVSGTNGKSTTTAMLAAACSAGGYRVVSNVEGANLASGVVTTLSSADERSLAILEVDELALPSILRSFDAPVVVLLNLSRDQLDRFGEVRTVAGRWRHALEGATGVTVIANADDPLVVWSASATKFPVFVGARLTWRHDNAACPACGGLITVADDGRDWSCSTCDLRRPPAIELDEGRLWDEDMLLAAVQPGVPGRHNLANAAMATVAAIEMGVAASDAERGIKSVDGVHGRYETVEVGGTCARLLLGKNPAGWEELLTLIEAEDTPLLIAINSRIADGRDPSWLWDVEFERLRGRSIVAAGERATDLAVRLRYADIDCDVWSGSLSERLRTERVQRIDVLANYTAFAGLLRELQGMH